MRTISLLLLMIISLNASAQFEANGELLGESLRSWRTESERDQMATMTTIIIKILNISDPIDARNKAVSVRACVNKVAADFMAGEKRVADVAVMCIAQLGYLRG